MDRLRVLLCLMTLGVGGAWGQTMAKMPVEAQPVFEVATIKPSDPADQSQGFQTRGRRIVLRNESVLSMVMFAYSIHKTQIVGGPAWLGGTAYDVNGVPDVEGDPSLKQFQEMVQAPLADRFKLTFHRERRELPYYSMTEGKGGSKLVKSTHDPNEMPDQTGNGGHNQQMMVYTNNSLDDFAMSMQDFMEKPVVNQSGVSGRFDFTLKWTPNELLPTEPNAPPGMLTAIREQLGLKLEATKGLVEVIVIDSLERPSVN